MKRIKISSVPCPACGGQVSFTDTKCPFCNHTLVFDYSALMRVEDYDLEGRDAAVDSVVLGLVFDEAAKMGVEVIPTMNGSKIDFMVRTQDGELEHTGSYDDQSREQFYSTEPYHSIGMFWRTKMGNPKSRIYQISEGWPAKNVEGEIKLREALRPWAKAIVTLQSPEVEPEQKPRFNIFDPSTW